MNQLPEVFPLRYAVVIEAGNDEELNDRPLLPDPKIEMLFRQYVLKLQKEPITKNLLRPASYFVKASFSDIDVGYLAKLADNNQSGSMDGWLSETSQSFEKMLPGVVVNSSGWGFFLNVSLYSYRGALEFPSFIKFWKETKNTDFYKTRDKFDLDGSMFGFFYHKYKQILNDEISSWELYQLLAKYRQPIRIDAPYSDLWKFLDSGKNGGIITSNIHQQENVDILNSLPNKTKEHNDHIEIVICRSWEELFAEELSAFYKTLKRCRNCNKPLPFNYKGNYCPDMPENKNCVKERNRKRKSQVKE